MTNFSLLSELWLHIDRMSQSTRRVYVKPILNLSIKRILYFADLPLHYSRLKLFTSAHTRVSEVEGGSTIGYRPRLHVGKRLLLRIRQLRHIRKIASDHGVSVAHAVCQLIVFPAWRDAKARLELIARHFQLSAARSSPKT